MRREPAADLRCRGGWSRTRGRCCARRSTSRVCSPRYFRSCGVRPIEANGKICVPSPISVQPSMTADAPMRQFRPMRTFGPIVAYGPIDGAGADLGAADGRWRVGSISTAPAARASSRSASATTCSPIEATPCTRASGARRAAERHLEPQPVAGHDLAAELRVVDAAQVDAGRRGASALEQQDAWPPAPAPRSSARPASAASPGKWPWKNSSLTVTFLTATSRRPGSCWTTASTRNDG